MAEEVYMVEYPSVIVENLLKAPKLDITNQAVVTRIRDLKGLEEDCLSFVVNFETKGWFFSSGDPYLIAGELSYKKNNFGVRIEGGWNREIVTVYNGVRDTIWQRKPLPENYLQNYSMTLFALQLNSIDPDGDYLPTDSRLRPDQRALENGDLAEAALVKTELEKEQRQRSQVL